MILLQKKNRLLTNTVSYSFKRYCNALCFIFHYAGFLVVIVLTYYVDSIFSKALLYIPRPLDHRKYFIDLTPKILFAKSDILPILIKSRVHNYLEIKPLTSFHTYENDSFEKVPGTKEDIFTDQTLSLNTKRALMKFMKFVLDYNNTTDIWLPYKSRPIGEFLAENFKLEPQQVTELIYSIGLCTTSQTHTIDALSRIYRYITSFGVYGNFPALYVMYGGAGELVQAFSRSAAVAGAVYKLNTKITDYDSESKIAHLADGGKIQVSEKVILSSKDALKIPQTASLAASKNNSEVTRMVAIVSKDCKEWFAENEQAAVIAFPPGSLPSNNTVAVHALIVGGGSGMCPMGQSVWYLSSVEKGPKARADLEHALNRLESSILRESTEDFEFENLAEGDVSVRPDGMSVLSSVKLGQSLQNFVPREKLQFLLKLCYTQATSTVDNFEDENLGVYVVSPPSAEISYDGNVANAVSLYEKIVGSDDDFFDIDFEDDDDEAANKPPGLAAGGESAIQEEESEGSVHDDDDRAPVFGDDMEL